MRAKGTRRALVCKALQEHGPLSLADINLTVGFSACDVVSNLQLAGVVKRVEGKYALVRMPECVSRVQPSSGVEKILLLLKQSKHTAGELVKLLEGELEDHSVYVALNRMRRRGLVTRSKVPGKSYVWERVKE